MVGDVKRCELLGSRAPIISSQALRGRKEGSETTAWNPERIVKPHERTARKVSRDDIVRTARLNVQKWRIKSRHGNRMTTIQSRTGELADNVTNNNGLLRALKDRGNVKTFSGGNVIL